MTMTPFGPSEEKSLLGALKIATDLVLSGAEPDEALTKAAQDAQLHPDTVPLLVSAYNVGQQTHRREKCSSEKGGTSCLMEPYTIARLENVQGRLYPPTLKEASLEPVDDCYSMLPTPVLSYEAEKAAALAAIKLPTQMPPRRPAGEYLVADVYRLKYAAERAYQRMDDALLQSHEEFLTTLDDVCRYFKQSSDRRLSMAEAEFNSRSMFGSDVEGIFDVVGIRLKEARATGVVRSTRPALPTAEPYSLVKAAIDKARSFVAEEREVAAAKTKIASEVANADPFGVPPSPPISLLEDLPELDSSSKEAGFLSSLVGGAGGVAAAMKSLPVARSTPELVDDASDQLNKPDHLAEMRNVQVRSMLADLMANDDVVSGFDPSEVTDAYNEITQFSPNLATQSAAVRGLLRRRLTGGVLEAHDAQQLADIEKSLRHDNTQAAKPPQK